MKAIILNSGLGSRMGEMTTHNPKCLIQLNEKDTILSRQLRMLKAEGITDVIITTGYKYKLIEEYCESLCLDMNISFVHNPLYEKTNYIYSIYLARKQLHDDIILLHGDIVFEMDILHDFVKSKHSIMKISTVLPLPEKDFKAVIADGYIRKIGISYFENAYEAQAFYKLIRKDWEKWLNHIEEYCEKGITGCYAEEAFNEIAESIELMPFDCKDRLCSEIDNIDDLRSVKDELEQDEKTVYMCFSTDIIHSGHLSIIKKASLFGKLIVGVLSDEVVASYKRYPLVPYDERVTLLKNITGISEVIEQKKLSYKDVLSDLKPDFVVHGDDWTAGFQKPIREEVNKILNQYGGRLIEFPYSKDKKYEILENQSRAKLSMPDFRRGRLKRLLEIKGLINAIETHSGITGLIAEKTTVMKEGKTFQFDAMWISSLCDSTAKGKPDIELVDMTSRFRTIDDVMEVTTKPIIFDGDTGGLIEHFVYTVRSLERMGVSMIIIEDKTGLKKNSLFGNEVVQTQDSVAQFCEKIKAGKKAAKTRDFMICARIESLILEKGMNDALKRAGEYVSAGADAIMIHSRKKEPAEIFEFLELFRRDNQHTPIVLVPTSFNTVTEDEWKQKGANIIIYANQLTRSGFPAMQNAAKLILENHRAEECDRMCMSIKEIITLIPDEIV